MQNQLHADNEKVSGEKTSKRSLSRIKLDIKQFTSKLNIFKTKGKQGKNNKKSQDNAQRQSISQHSTRATTSSTDSCQNPTTKAPKPAATKTNWIIIRAKEQDNMAFDGVDSSDASESSYGQVGNQGDCSSKRRGRQSIVLKVVTSEDPGLLKVPVEETMSHGGSNTRQDSLTPTKDDDLSLKHRVIQGSTPALPNRSSKFDSASHSGSSCCSKNSYSDDDKEDEQEEESDEMDFDANEEVGSGKSCIQIVPVSINLEAEKKNRLVKDGHHSKTNKTTNCVYASSQSASSCITLQLANALLDPQGPLQTFPANAKNLSQQRSKSLIDPTTNGSASSCSRSSELDDKPSPYNRIRHPDDLSMSDSEIQASAQNDENYAVSDGQNTGQFGRVLEATVFQNNVEEEEQEGKEPEAVEEEEEEQQAPIVRHISASIVEEAEDNQQQVQKNDADAKRHSYDDKEDEIGENDQQVVYEVEYIDLQRAIIALKMKSTLQRELDEISEQSCESQSFVSLNRNSMLSTDSYGPIKGQRAQLKNESTYLNQKRAPIGGGHNSSQANKSCLSDRYKNAVFTKTDKC